MTRPTQLVVFSDLDGTLLDHDTYSWGAARPAVEALRQHDIPLVLVTSKTRAELQSLRTDLGNDHPYIVENGAAVCIPGGYFTHLHSKADDKEEHLISAGPVRNTLQESLSQVRQEGTFCFQSFAELGASEIARLTGLSQSAAGRANERAASEPLLWQDTESRLQTFSARIAEMQLRCVRGGRFVHVMGQFDKADAVARLVSLYAQKYIGKRVVTVALGDGPNDLQMLADVDIAVVVKGKHSYPMPLASPFRIVRTSVPGPAGWNQAILDILSDHMPSA